MKNKIPVIVAVLLGVVVIWQSVAISKLKQVPVGANSQFGMMAIYHNPASVIATGQGTALAVDSAGKLLISTTTALTVTLQ